MQHMQSSLLVSNLYNDRPPTWKIMKLVCTALLVFSIDLSFMGEHKNFEVVTDPAQITSSHYAFNLF